MADEDAYKYACMRAELLGIDKPDKDIFIMELQQKRQLQENEEERELQRLEEQGDSLKNIHGGLDELNNILSITQRKIVKFKTACGSLTNLLKLKVGHGDSTESINKSVDVEEIHQSTSPRPEIEELIADSDDQKSLTSVVSTSEKKKDFEIEVNKQVNALDALLMKADNAHSSLTYQNKQMKKILKK